MKPNATLGLLSGAGRRAPADGAIAGHTSKRDGPSYLLKSATVCGYNELLSMSRTKGLTAHITANASVIRNPRKEKQAVIHPKWPKGHAGGALKLSVPNAGKDFWNGSRCLLSRTRYT